MSMLPALLRLRFRGWPALWLPLFLCWPLVPLLLVGVFAAVYVLEARAAVPRASAFARVVSVWQLLCATRGIRVDVADPIQFGISIH
jgi:hypothetical protein